MACVCALLLKWEILSRRLDIFGMAGDIFGHGKQTHRRYVRLKCPNVWTFFLCLLFLEHFTRRQAAEDGTGIIVHPVLDARYILFAIFGYVSTLRDMPPDHLV